MLIPWAASEATLDGGITLSTCWLASMIWTFGFDTVYAMADQNDDKKIGLNSSALALGTKVYILVSICYGLTSLLIATSALEKGIEIIFWPFWIIATIGMQREIFSLKLLEPQITNISRHFKNQVKSTLLKKSVKMEDICNTAEFLIQNNSLTGQIIAVDSGQNLSWNKKNEKE